MTVLLTIAIVLAVIAIAIALVALAAALSAHHKIAHLARPGRAVHQSLVLRQYKEKNMTEQRQRHAPWVIYNPVKVEDRDEFEALIRRRAAATGYLEPHFVETTEESPGTLQALDAVQADADLVIVAGGDGTQRAVAAGLAHSQIPIGIIPAGTGNLLARNLDLPVGSLEEAVEVALTGSNFTVDLGWLEVRDAHAAGEAPQLPAEGEHLRRGLEQLKNQEPSPALKNLLAKQTEHSDREYAFLVMSGVGFDADMMASTSDKLKKSIGWLAYVVSGVQEHRSPRLKAKIRLGDENPGKQVKARTVLLANCGQLPGNVALLPDAAPGDGWIDVAVLDTRRGVLGWLELGWRIIAQGFGVRRAVPSLSSTLKTRKARAVDLRLDRRRHTQVDGDVVGESMHIRARLDRSCLIYRIP